MKRAFYFFADLIYNMLSPETQDKIQKDVIVNFRDECGSFKRLVIQNLSYRSVFYWRVHNDGQYPQKLILRIATKLSEKYIFPPLETVEFSSESVGGGIVIYHRYCVVNAKSIGDNVVVYQGVTIGKGKGGKPKIGNDVKLFPNSIIVGDITIGNGTWIGAGSFIDSDIPDNSTVRNDSIVLKRRGV